MKANREDVVQAALVVERWCKEHKAPAFLGGCDCPFYAKDSRFSPFYEKGECFLYTPFVWHLEEKLRTRGLKDD